MMLMWPRRTTYNRSDLLGLREKMLAQVDEVFVEYWQIGLIHVDSDSV
jgi:hypothetical protein